MTERVAVGRVGKAHGLDGSFVVEDASEDERWFRVGARLLAGEGEAEVVAAKRAGGRPVVRLDRHVARGTELEVERTAPQAVVVPVPSCNVDRLTVLSPDDCG